MKGGITSGAIYAKAVSHLAQRYHFRNIGGTSAGAIAAAMAAAAEHGRSQDGFAKLDAIPGELGTRLTMLFQPSSATRPLYRTLLAAVTKPVKPLRVVRAVVAARPVWFAVGLAAVLLPAFAGLAIAHGLPIAGGDWWLIAVGLLLSLPLAFAVGLLAAAVGLALLANRVLPENGFGLCNGHDKVEDHAPLTDWLAMTIDDLAGLPADSRRPLTLGDLWDGGRTGPLPSAAYLAALDAGGASAVTNTLRRDRKVNLEMMTTNLTTRRPHRLPFDNDQFSFCPTEMEALFPEYVVAHLVENSAERADKPDGDAVIELRCPNHPDQQLRSFPAAPNLPVIVITRMSLSFPVLLSAIPLYAVDYARAKGHRRVERMWFSDGGISSNFPMHFFDALWPSRPTFGINLQPQHPDHPDQMTYRPTTAGAGILPRAIPFNSMAGFAGAVMDTMQNWADTALIKLPGYRERVVEVRTRPNEGGMNLVMDDATIRDLADRGVEAAATFDEFAFDEHRWIRHRVAMAQLSRAFTGMRGLWDAGVTPTYEQLLPVPKGYPYAESAAFRAQDAEASRKLMDLADAWDGLGNPGRTEPPHPEPDLRLTPPL
jgi:predicted acylesterase/phospholipase RssA